MTTEHKDFEVISNSSSEPEPEPEPETVITESKILGNDDSYSQDDRTFMFELYRENRNLIKQISEKDAKIAKLDERVTYLTNSNAFWLCCYIGSSAIGLFSLIHH